MSLKKQPISYLSMQHPFFNAGQRRAKMYKTCIRSTCQCNTPFLTQGSEEQKCTKRASVQPLVYLYLYVYRYVSQIYSCKEDRILYRLTFHLKNNQSVTCQCNTPFLSVTCQCNTPFLTHWPEESCAFWCWNSWQPYPRRILHHETREGVGGHLSPRKAFYYYKFKTVW